MAERGTGKDGRPKKRTRSEAVAEFFTESPTIEERAEPFLVATAVIPFSVLTCQWRKGFNRRIQDKHILDLCKAFESDSVRRRVQANFLRVQCGSEAIARMLQYLQSESRSGCDKKTVVSFSEWATVNPGLKLEVMAGQHRMNALRLHAQRTGVEEETELWWTCKVYSADKLPLDLDQQLRMNRRDVMLPDSDGEIWSQIVQAQDRDKTLFDGNKATTIKRLRAELQLGGAFKFPVDRVVTLWNNARWREMLRQWSETELGRSNFSVYMFEWMAGLRIDEYWMGVLKSALETLHGFPEGMGLIIRTEDWENFVLTERQSEGWEGWEGWDAHFFPPAADSPKSGAKGQQHRQRQRRRRPGFLSNMSDGTYEAILAHVKNNPSLHFADVGWLRKISKEKGQILSKIVSHVVDWLNPRATIVIHQQRSNKPQYREDFLPALWAYYQRQRTEAHSQELLVEYKSQWLEWAVIEAAWEHIAFFASEEGKATLEKRYRGEDGGYAARFKYEAWGAILRTVEQAFDGDDTSPLPWKSALVCSGGGCEEGNNTCKAAALGAVALVVGSVRRSNRMASNNSLGTEAALQKLSEMLSDTVRRWAYEGEESKGLHEPEAADVYVSDTPWNGGGSGSGSGSPYSDDEGLLVALDEPGQQGRDKDGETPFVERGTEAPLLSTSSPSIPRQYTDTPRHAVPSPPAETRVTSSQVRVKLTVSAQSTRSQDDSHGNRSKPSESTEIRSPVPARSSQRLLSRANSPMTVNNNEPPQRAHFGQRGQIPLPQQFTRQKQLERQKRLISEEQAARERRRRYYGFY